MTDRENLHPEHSKPGVYVSKGKAFERDMRYIDDRIVADPANTPKKHDDQMLWPIEAGRYRLAAAKACPWANRTLIVRRLLGLEDAISLALAGPTHDERSWTFDLDEGGVDPVLGIERLQQAYFARFPNYPRGSPFRQLSRWKAARWSRTTSIRSPWISRRNGLCSTVKARQICTLKRCGMRWTS